MGDFNEEPFDTSLVTHALSTRQRTKVTHARDTPLLWNLMWPTAGIPDGSFYFSNQPNVLDQFLVNMALADAPLQADPDTARVLKPPRHDRSRRLPQAHSFRRHGQTRRSERLLRPLPHHPHRHRPRLTNGHEWLELGEGGRRSPRCVLFRCSLARTWARGSWCRPLPRGRPGEDRRAAGWACGGHRPLSAPSALAASVAHLQVSRSGTRHLLHSIVS